VACKNFILVKKKRLHGRDKEEKFGYYEKRKTISCGGGRRRLKASRGKYYRRGDGRRDQAVSVCFHTSERMIDFREGKNIGDGRPGKTGGAKLARR